MESRRQDLIAECVWPPLPAPYADALRQAVAYILGELTPVGIIATGTIVHGRPHATSDLDIIVVHHASFRRRIQRFFSGVPAEIFVNPPHTTRRYFADEHRDARPVSAHMIATGVVVLATDPVVDTLRAEARDWLSRTSPMSDDAITRGRYTAATLLEDGTDVADVDPATATVLLGRSVTAMLELFCHRRNGRLPRAKELLATVAAADQDIGSLASSFFLAPSIVERRAIAETIADRVLETRGFFEWDSGPEETPPPG